MAARGLGCCVGFLSLWLSLTSTLGCGVQASCGRGFSGCGAWARGREGFGSRSTQA